MSTSVSEHTAPTEHRVGYYIYGIVPSDVEVDPSARGIGDPPIQVQAIRRGEIAALVSEIDIDSPIGRPQDLLAHESLLDATAAEVPVLPVRFGAVVGSLDAVAD